MGYAYRIHKQEAAYFLTFTIVDWVDIFSRNSYKKFLCESLNYCVQQKSLRIFSYVIMTNHVHLICRTESFPLSGFVRDFKKFTSGNLIKLISTENESRRKWMLEIFSKHGSMNSLNEKFQLWQNNSHAKEVYGQKFTLQKINYIHANPVRSGFVNSPEQYPYSSAQDYAGKKGPVDVVVINLHSLM